MEAKKIKKVICSMVAFGVFTAALPVLAAPSISSFKIGRDYAVVNADNNTGDYLFLDFKFKDASSLFLDFKTATYASGKYTTTGTVSNKQLFASPATYITSEVSGGMKIDADLLTTATFPVDKSYELVLRGTKGSDSYSSKPVYFNFIGSQQITTFDAYITSVGNLTNRMDLWQDNVAVTTAANTEVGRKLVISYNGTFGLTRKLYLVNGATSTLLTAPNGATARTATYDPDALAIGKYNVQLKAINTVGPRSATVYSSKTFGVSVLGKPTMATITTPKLTAVRTAATPATSGCISSTATGTDKIVINYTGKNLSKLYLTVDGKDYEVSSPSSKNKNIAFDVDCLATTGTKTINFKGYNQRIYGDKDYSMTAPTAITATVQ